MKSAEPVGWRRSISVSGNQYATWALGDGPLVLLLHGWPVSSRHWRRTVPALVEAGYRTLCVDIKGLGESSAADSNFSKDKIARELLSVIDQLEPKARCFTAVGHDWGGSIAIALAALKPKRVRCLIIEDEIPPGITAPLRGKSIDNYPTWHGAFHRTKRLPEKLIPSHLDEYIDFFLDLRFAPTSLSVEDRKYYRAYHRSKKKLARALAYYRCARQDALFFSRLRTRKLKTPVLAVWGEFGMGAAVSDSLKQIVSNVSTCGIRKCGHYPAGERPLSFNRAVISFLHKHHYRR